MAFGRFARALFMEGIVSLVKAYATVLVPLVGLAIIMWFVVGNEAWGPLWWFLEESASISIRIALCVLLLPFPFAVIAAFALACVALAKSSPELRWSLIHRLLRLFRWIVAPCATSSDSLTVHLPSTFTPPAQMTLVNSVGLTSVARRLQ